MSLMYTTAAEELADFAHHREAYEEQKWMEDRITIFLERNIVIPRSELPAVTESDTNGFVTALAQEQYQPQLRYTPTDGDKPGEWNRRIAYANLAVADAVEAKEVALAANRATRRDELASEFTAVNSYNAQLPYTQKLIDRIIELEEASK